MTTPAGPDIVPHRPADLPQLAAADRGVADSLTAVLSDNTRRTYATQWRIFDGWCGEVGLTSPPAGALTVARHLEREPSYAPAGATLYFASLPDFG